MEKQTTKTNFLKQFRLTEKDLEDARITWDELTDVRASYRTSLEDRTVASEVIARVLRREPHVHSVRLRLKAEDHLLEKIIRKRKADPKRSITIDNYDNEIVDLIGIRILHLYKRDWIHIHKFLTNMFPHREGESPVAYVRKGDDENSYKAEGLAVEVHDHGYRSVHYTVAQAIGSRTFLAEVQVRTVFEEGWSEVDHDVRYPYNLNNSLTNECLQILNRLAGSADELGQFVVRLRDTHNQELETIAALDQQNQDLLSRQKENEQMIDALQNKLIRAAEVGQERDELLRQLEKLKAGLVTAQRLEAARATSALHVGLTQSAHVATIQSSHFRAAIEEIERRNRAISSRIEKDAQADGQDTFSAALRELIESQPTAVTPALGSATAKALAQLVAAKKQSQ